MTKIVPTDKARQGGPGRQVLFVLIGALVLTAIGWGAVEIYGWTIAPTEIDTQTTAPSG